MAYADRIRERQIERRKMAEINKNNPQEDMLFIQKEFRTLTQRSKHQIQIWMDYSKVSRKKRRHWAI